ncbi:MAG: MFS transporter, partial [Caldilineaceae bacterium]|nr:MFS transporter [Caldilineaceae bacterium]
MSTKTTASTATEMMQKASWLPMVILVMAQLQMAFNINALPVSIGPIVEDLNTPATSVATGLVLYS